MNNIEINNPFWLQTNSKFEEQDNFSWHLIDEPNAAAQYIASNNAVQYEFAPIVNLNTPVKAKLTISIVGNIPADSILSFQYGSSSFSAIAKNAPIKSNEFKTSTFSGIVYQRQVAAQIAAILRRKSDIRNNYNLNVLGNVIEIEAKTATNTFFDFSNLTAPAGVSLSTIAGVNRYNMDTFFQSSLEIRINIATVDDFVGNGLLDKTKAANIATLKHDFNQKNVLANVENSLKDWVQYVKPFDFNSITNNILTTQICKDTLRPFFITYYYRYAYEKNSTPLCVPIGVSSVKSVHLSSFDRLSPYNLGEYVWNDGAFSPSFLTNFKQKTTFREQHEYLQIIRAKGINDDVYGIDIQYVLNDGTTGAYQIQSPTTYGGLNGNIRFNVSFDKIGLNNVEFSTQKEILSYSIRLFWVNPVSTFTYYSKPVNYKVETHCNSRVYNIIWGNKLGAIDTRMFNSDVNITTNRTTKSYPRYIDEKENRLNIVDFPTFFGKTETDTLFTLSSGFVKRDEYLKMNDLLSSPFVMIYDAEFDKYRKINIIEAQWNAASDKQHYNLTISFTTSSFEGVNDNNIEG